MRRAFYIREVTASDTRSIDATPYASKEGAMHVIMDHLGTGSIRKGWVVDQDEGIVISADDISDFFHLTQKPE